MKAADITIGEAYLAEYEYGRSGKVTVLDVPVVRMVTGMGGKRKPYRRDGRADGARVRVERTGETADVALTKVKRPWGAADDSREDRRDECVERVAAVRAKLAEMGMPNEQVWRGEATTAEMCTVALPFVEFEAFLRRVDPVEVVKDVISAARAELAPSQESFTFACEIERQAVVLRERWAAGFAMYAEPPIDDAAF